MAKLNRELCMLAENFNPGKHRSAGTYLSEKLDGMRCLWIPKTRGMAVKDVPFANREKDKREHTATGLWSRYGKIIHCPAWFVEDFPPYPLDGELYIGRKAHQTLMSVVKTLEPTEDWRGVTYNIFDSPRHRQVFVDGRINNPNYQLNMKLEKVLHALAISCDQPLYDFDQTYKLLRRDLKQTTYLRLHEQTLLPFSTLEALIIINNELERVTDLGGEGLMIRHPCSMWTPTRSPMLCKVKKLEDAEALVIGYRAGLGKHLGRLGSLQVRFGATIFDLGGFTDQERVLESGWDDWARNNPGELLPHHAAMYGPIVSRIFPLNEMLTFRYRELSDDGIPKEARFLRKRND